MLYFLVQYKTGRHFHAGKDRSTVLSRAIQGQLSMIAIKSYSMRVEADLARITLEGAGIPAVVVGIGVNMDGGIAGVKLLVPDDRIDEALKVLEGVDGGSGQ